MITHHYTNNNSITTKDIPPNTEELVLYDDFDKLIYQLPSNVKFIKFGKLFNKQVTNVSGDKTKCYLHDGLTSIKFGEHYNQVSDNLPKNLQSLTFGWFFDQCVKTLPSNLEYLEFGFNFNHEINLLPSKLKYLTLGYNFDKSLELIPGSIIRLTIFNNNDRLLNNIPQFVQELELNDRITDKKIHNFPVCLQKLIIRNYKTGSKYQMNKIPFGCEIIYNKIDGRYTDF
jgi:hypothetical protein